MCTRCEQILAKPARGITFQRFMLRGRPATAASLWPLLRLRRKIVWEGEEPPTRPYAISLPSPGGDR